MGKRIMLVDDSDDVRFTVKDSLSSIDKSYLILEARNGDECLSLVKKNNVDLILLDIMMPGKDGTEVATELKNDSKTKDIPIIFLTAKTDELTKKFASTIGKDYISKPFDLDELDKKIKSKIKKK